MYLFVLCLLIFISSFLGSLLSDILLNWFIFKIGGSDYDVISEDNF